MIENFSDSAPESVKPKHRNNDILLKKVSFFIH